MLTGAAGLGDTGLPTEEVRNEISSTEKRRIMRKSILIMALVLAGSVSLQAETCITTREHTDASYHHGTVDPATDSEGELWIGGGRMASIDEDYQLIFDFKKILSLLVAER